MGENLKLVAYCGLYCPKCYKMVVSSKAEALKDALENTHICGSPDEPFEDFKKELGKLIALKCKMFCREGGGKPGCLIKQCCKSKNLVGCWECSDFSECKKLKKQFVDNIKNIRELGIDGFVSVS